MPTFEVSKKDLEKLVGRKFTIKELEDEALLYAKTELDGHEGDKLKLDVKDTNRPDLWSVEGIARELRGNYKIESGLKKYLIKKSGLQVFIESGPFHPFATAAVVRNVNIDEEVLSQMIQLQEKVGGTFGRNRKAMSMGAYDMSKIKFPVKYVSKKPFEIKFKPLGSDKEMTAKEIIQTHDKGRQYGHLLEGVKEYNVWVDASGKILAMEPIINSNDAGNVTTKTKDVFIECTGYNWKDLHTALNVLVTALAERGGKIESVEVVHKGKILVMPDLEPKKSKIDPDYCRKILGLNISDTEIIKLLKEARYDAKLSGKTIHVDYPAYRQDIMHQRDIVEDVAISFGYNDIKTDPPILPTIGSGNGLEKFSNIVREVCVGLGLQEVLTFILTNKDSMFGKMDLREGDIVEIENPVSNNWSVFRNSLIPNLLEFFVVNKNQEYPQKIFEVGDIVLFDKNNKETGVSNKRMLSVALTDTFVGYEDVSSVLDALLSNIGLKFSLKKTIHKSFIPGRVAEIIVNGKSIGVIGEIHPKVLNNWNLEKGVVCFELGVEVLSNSVL